ncbi:MAG: hypothetical protein KKG10_05645 [Proteobacteria bacterium]|nr:hypothetical protein [Pseudomonadota bacterium]
MDFCKEVREVSIRQRLKRSQTRALEKFKDASEEEIGVGSARTVETMGTSRVVPAHYPLATDH